MVAYTARKNPLAMPTGAPAPAPAYDVSADAYQPGAMSAAPRTASPMAPSAGSPFSPPQGPPRNALLASALDGFQRGLDPAGFEKRETANKAAEGDKLKQTLALMQQQRAIPEAQRGQWWQQNAPTISKIIGQDVSQMPLDVSKFTDQALDGQIAALSAQAGIGPVVSEAYTLAPGAQRYGADGRVVASNPGIEKTRAPIIIGNVAYDPETYQPVITGPEAAYTLSPDQVRMRGDEEIARGLSKPPANGINLTFGEGGAVSGLSIGGPSMGLGGTGTKGNEPAVVRSPQTGGPVVTPGEQQLVANKSWQSLKAGGEKVKLVRDEIARALPLVKENTTGALASTKDLWLFGPSTESGRLAQLLKTVKANIGFDELQQMRENSPTGGALGQVAVQEIDFLQSVLGSLEQAQRPEDVKYNLRRIDNYLANRDERRREAFAIDYPELAEFAGFAKRTAAEIKRIQGDDDFDALPSGAEFIGPDNIKRVKP
jgi:hypothetical protein